MQPTIHFLVLKYETDLKQDSRLQFTQLKSVFSLSKG